MPWRRTKSLSCTVKRQQSVGVTGYTRARARGVSPYTDTCCCTAHTHTHTSQDLQIAPGHCMLNTRATCNYKHSKPEQYQPPPTVNQPRRNIAANHAVRDTFYDVTKIVQTFIGCQHCKVQRDFRLSNLNNKLQLAVKAPNIKCVTILKRTLSFRHSIKTKYRQTNKNNYKNSYACFHILTLDVVLQQ